MIGKKELQERPRTRAELNAAVTDAILDAERKLRAAATAWEEVERLEIALTKTDGGSPTEIRVAEMGVGSASVTASVLNSLATNTNDALHRRQLDALKAEARLIAYPDETEPGVFHVYAQDDSEGVEDRCVRADERAIEIAVKLNYLVYRRS